MPWSGHMRVIHSDRGGFRLDPEAVLGRMTDWGSVTGEYRGDSRRAGVLARRVRRMAADGARCCRCASDPVCSVIV